MSEIINFTRLTTSDRMSDRFLTCQVYQPFEEELKDKGIILSQVEILNPWFPVSQVGQTVINTLIREYYKADDTSDLNNFEESIKQVNESLAQVAQTGETDWIGKLSSVLVLIVGKEAHFAQTGQSHAYLYRGDKINHITEGLDAESSPHPLKTFTNLTSGSLQEGDKIVIANSAFFEAISPEDLSTIITENHPAAAAIESAKIFKNRGMNHANAIFLELTTKDKLANLSPDEKVETIYINEQLTSLTTNLKSIWRNLIIPVAIHLKNYSIVAYRKIKTALSPVIKRSAAGAKEKSKKAINKAYSSAKSGKNKLHGKVNEKLVSNKSERQPEGKKSTLYLTAVKMKNKIRRYLIRLGFSKAHGPRVYLFAVIAMVLILALTIGLSSYQRTRTANNKRTQEKLAQITALKGEAAALMVNNNDSEALDKYKRIVTLASELQGTNYEEDANTSKDEAWNKILDITQAKRLESTDTIDLPENSQVLVLNNGSLISITNNNLYELNNDSFDEAAKLSNELNIVYATYAKENIVAISDSNNLFTISQDGKASQNDVSLNARGEIENYQDNVYILDQASNQIWKLVNDEGYSESSPYLKDSSVDLSNATSIAIDGSIYTIANSCDINRLSRGESLSSFVPSLPAGESIELCSNIYTNEDYNDLMIISGNDPGLRAVHIQKNGTFINQYLLSDAGNVSQALFDTNNNKLYISADGKLKIYELN